MKKYFFSSLVLLFTCVSFDIFALAKIETEKEFAHSLYLNIKKHSSMDTFDTFIDSAKKEINAHKLDEKKVFQCIISYLDQDISHYKEIIDNPKNIWGEIFGLGLRTGLCLWVASGFGKDSYDCYVKYKTNPIILANLEKGIQQIEEGIIKQKAQHFFANGFSGSAWIPNYLNKAQKNKIIEHLDLLVSAHRQKELLEQHKFVFSDVIFGSVFAVLGISLATWLITKTVCKILEKKNSKPYYEKYCLMKKRLEEYCENIQDSACQLSH